MYSPDLCLTGSLSYVHYAWSWYQCIMNTYPICKRRTQRRYSRNILCHSYQADIHYNCSGLLLDDFESALSDGNWFSRQCVEGFFPFIHFYDDNDFMKCIEELSQPSDIAARLHNSTKLFNAFDINEDDNDIIEYHGDIHPYTGWILFQWIFIYIITELQLLYWWPLQ